MDPETNHVTNGLLLRAVLHTVFDTLLLAVDPETLEVLVSPRIQDPMYRALHGQALRMTKTRASAPSEAAVRERREGCGFWRPSVGPILSPVAPGPHPGYPLRECS